MLKNFSVILADDHSVVRGGVSMILKRRFPSATIFHTSTFKEVIEILDREKKVTLLLLDINIPGGNSTQMIDEVKELQSDIKILIFSAHDEKHYAIPYIKAGASGFLNKQEEEDEIVYAVRQVLTKGKYISPTLRENMLAGIFDKKHANPLKALSKREFDIACLLVKGEGNLEIANRLKLHMSTVSTYKARIFKKLNIDNVLNLAEIFKMHQS